MERAETPIRSGHSLNQPDRDPRALRDSDDGRGSPYSPYSPSSRQGRGLRSNSVPEKPDTTQHPEVPSYHDTMRFDETISPESPSDTIPWYKRDVDNLSRSVERAERRRLTEAVKEALADMGHTPEKRPSIEEETARVKEELLGVVDSIREVKMGLGSEKRRAWG